MDLKQGQEKWAILLASFDSGFTFGTELQWPDLIKSIMKAKNVRKALPEAFNCLNVYISKI